MKRCQSKLETKHTSWKIMPGSQEGQEEGPLNHPRDIIDSHTGVIFKKQEILKFSDIYLYQIGKFMYLFKRGLLPNYFRDMFTLASQIHSYNTRNSSLFYIPHCRTNFRKFSIRFQGPTFFNSLSREIQNSESISLFGKRLKKSLLS